MKFTDDMLFAHPVLSAESGDFRNAEFDASFECTVDAADNLTIVATIALKCPDVLALIESGEAGCGFFLICRQTYMNRLIEMVPGTKIHPLDARDFFGTLQLRPVIWTKQERVGWQSASLHPEYSGFADLPVAAILALGEEQRFSIDRERLKPFESIFALATADNLEPGQFAVDLERDKITIIAHTETKHSIEGVRNNPLGRQVLLNAVYFPVVMQVLADVSADRSQYADKAWFRIFEAKCAAAGVKIEDPNLLHDAQRLLAWPFRAIEKSQETLFA